MRASLGMTEESADFVGRFGRQNMFKLASLLFDFRFTVKGEAVCKQALSQPVTANDIGRALAAARREFHDHAALAS
jgi:hypothetical protein